MNDSNEEENNSKSRLTVMRVLLKYVTIRASLVAQTVKNAYNAGHNSLIPGLGRSPGEGNGYPLQYSGLESSMYSPCGPQTERLALSGTTKTTPSYPVGLLGRKRSSPAEMRTWSAFKRKCVQGNA